MIFVNIQKFSLFAIEIIASILQILLKVDYIIHMTIDVIIIRIILISANKAISNTNYQLNRNGYERKRTHCVNLK